MAAASYRPSHGSFCLLLLLAAAAAIGAAGTSSHVQLSPESLLSTADSSCSTPQEQQHGAGTGTTRMPVVHQHGLCSPLADKRGKAAAPSHTKILAADQRRVAYIHRRVSETATGRSSSRPRRAAAPLPVHLRPGSPSSTTPTSSYAKPSSSANLPASSGESLDTGNYVVTVGLGTPAWRQTVVFDTGSDTTWVQCEPCVARCYRQKEPIFNPARSSTYANISCSSSDCSNLDVSSCDGGHCLYGVQYGDGSYTVGFYARDTLTLARDAVGGFRFGCGERNSGLFGRAAGLMGLGRGKSSLTVQAYAKYGGVFAYCLPASPSGTTGFLDFGAGGERAAHADAGRQRADVLLRGDDGDQGGREDSGDPGDRLLRRRRAVRLRHGDHEAAAVGVRADAVGVRQGDGRAGLQEGAGVLDPRHLLRPLGVPGEEHRAAAGVAGVPRRRVPRRRRVGDPVRRRRVAGVPGVRAQRRRHRGRHRRQHAAEDVRRAVRPRQEGRRLRARRVLIRWGAPAGPTSK